MLQMSSLITTLFYRAVHETESLLLNSRWQWDGGGMEVETAGGRERRLRWETGAGDTVTHPATH